MAERRTYTDEEKAAGLAALALHGGDVSKAARAMGVPRGTLIRWRDTAPELVRQIGQHKTDDLAALMERIALRSAGILEMALEALGEDVALALDHISDLNRIMGTATDKHQLLTGGATSRIEQIIELDLGATDAD